MLTNFVLKLILFHTPVAFKFAKYFYCGKNCSLLLFGEPEMPEEKNYL